MYAKLAHEHEDAPEMRSALRPVRSASTMEIMVASMFTVPIMTAFRRAVDCPETEWTKKY